jgi:hypothetical protein
MANNYNRGLCYFTGVDGEAVFMEVVTDYSYNLSASTTDNKLEDGSNISDNIVLNKRKVKFNGVVTDMIDLGGPESDIYAPSAYRDSLEKCMIENHVFDLVIDDWDFSTLPDCVITNVELNRDVTNTYGYSVSVSIEQLRFVEAARITSSEVRNPDFQDPLSSTENAGSGAKSQVDPDLDAKVRINQEIAEIEAELKNQDEGVLPNGG